MMTPEVCPYCSADLRGNPIPEEYRQAGYYGPPDSASTHYSRVVGHEESTIYDGILYWGCPDCGGTWHRWPEGSRMRRFAEIFVRPPGDNPE